MANYREMYYKLFRATEKAINTLISAQQECEELYLSSTDGEIIKLTPEDSDENNNGKQ